MPEMKPLIFLTNDDGIHSPGIKAALQALVDLGEVHVLAPSEQSTSSARSTPVIPNIIIQEHELSLENGRKHPALSINGTPAHCVQYAMLNTLPRRPDLVVSGINYGLNIATGVTNSGTVGATLEAAAFHLRSVAISMGTPSDADFSLSHSSSLDFATARHFLSKGVRAMLSNQIMPPVQILKIEIPHNASLNTPWEVNPLSKERFYVPIMQEKNDGREHMWYTIDQSQDRFEEGSDAHTVLFKKKVSFTPLSADLTANLHIQTLSEQLDPYLKEN
ncbi:MAG: 5'/3'-nucleotidase SurE [Anaerolineaceae bacterium]|nr:5'/3'-nucleotidase SurE [Anaerolineaceae bacterium]